MSVCVRALKRKRVELSTPNLVDTYYIDPDVKRSNVKVAKIYEMCCRREYARQYGYQKFEDAKIYTDLLCSW